MTEIACACVLCHDESLYDEFTATFISIIQQSIAIRDAASMSADMTEMMEVDHGQDMPKHSADRGWMWPLYFTARKCRVYPVRFEAAELIADHTHREGAWDSQQVAWVARKVVQIEHGDVIQTPLGSRRTNISPETTIKDFPLPSVPLRKRIIDMQVEYDETKGTDKLVLIYSRRQSNDAISKSTTTYDTILQKWTDDHDHDDG